MSNKKLIIYKTICLTIAIIMIFCTTFSVLAVSSGEAYIASPSNGDWLDTTQKITFRVVKPNSKSTLKITIKNDVTGTFIAQNEEFSGTSYTLNANVLTEKQRYKVWVGTFENGTAIGQGDVIYINTNDVKYEPAYFTSPSANDTVSADSNLKISWSKNSALAYWLSINDETTGKKILDEKELHLGYYVIDKSLLIAGHKYKAWIGTYVSSAIEMKLLGDGDTIYFSTNNVSSDGADFSYPKEGDVLDPAEDITIKFKNCDSKLVHKIAIREVDGDRVIINNQTFNGNSFVIKANTLDYGKNYRLWIGTYLNQSAENSMDAGHIIYIWTEEPEDKLYEEEKEDEYEDEYATDDITYEYDEGNDDESVLIDLEKNNFDNDEIFDEDTYEYNEGEDEYKDLYEDETDDGIYDDVPTNHKNYDAIISMSHKGILSGYGDGTFRPDAYVTRAEFTKMMNAAGLLDKDGGFKRGMPSFTDTQSHWAVNDINKAYMVGAIDGYDQFSFIPNNNITFQEAAKILSVLVGADEDDIKQKGGWPYGYIWFAYDNDIGANTSFEVSSSTGKSYEYVGNKISRADAAQMVYNAMPLNDLVDKAAKVNFEDVLEETASIHFGNTYKTYVSSSDTPWCVYCATKIAQDALKAYGVTDKEAKNIVPTEGSTARLINYYSREKYHNFTKYTSLVTGVLYSPKCYSNKDYTPKVGDFVFVETGSKIEITDDNGNKKKVDNPGPDHTELIVSVDEENSTFITIAGNTSTPTVCYKDYEYNTNKKMWTRKGSSTYVHGFISPDYPV